MAYCKWCGMQTSTQDTCEWCHRMLDPGVVSAGERQPPRSPPEAPPGSRPTPTLNSAAPGERWERYLAYAGITTATGALMIRFSANVIVFWVVLALALFVCGLLLAITRVAPGFDDQYADVAAGYIFTYFAGPLGWLVYTLAAFVLRRANNGFAAVLSTFWVVTGVLGLVYGGTQGLALLNTPVFMGLNLVGMTIGPALLTCTIIGWTFSSFFLPLSE